MYEAHTGVEPNDQADAREVHVHLHKACPVSERFCHSYVLSNQALTCLTLQMAHGHGAIDLTSYSGTEGTVIMAVNEKLNG